MAEWLRSPLPDQQVDLEGLGSNPGAGKLDAGFQLSENEFQLRMGLGPGLRFTSIISKEVTRLSGQRRAK